MEGARQLVSLTVQGSMFLMIMAVAMQSHWPAVVSQLRNPRLLLRGVLAVNIAVPVAAIVMVLILPLETPVAQGLILMAVSPLAPLVPGNAYKLGATRSHILAIYLALIILALAIVPGLFADRPAATLRIDASYTDETAGWIDSNSVYLRQLGVEIDDIIRYENYEEMQVWASRPGTSQRCIFVVFGNQGLWGLNCTPRGLDPITDVTLGPSAVPPSMRESAPDLPDGSVMRFTLKGESVEVRIATPDIVDPVAR